MENIELKEKLLYYIENGDEALLNRVLGSVSSYKLNTIFSTGAAYNKDIEESLEHFKRGDFITQKELEEQSKKW
ncbi:MAG TPA: hypothetical protein VF623_01365 [Segetibacter sp.]|jgi:hypothetical protein